MAGQEEYSSLPLLLASLGLGQLINKRSMVKAESLLSQ